MSAVRVETAPTRLGRWSSRTAGYGIARAMVAAVLGALLVSQSPVSAAAMPTRLVQPAEQGPRRFRLGEVRLLERAPDLWMARIELSVAPVASEPAPILRLGRFAIGGVMPTGFAAIGQPLLAIGPTPAQQLNFAEPVKLSVPARETPGFRGEARVTNSSPIYLCSRAHGRGGRVDPRASAQERTARISPAAGRPHQPPARAGLHAQAGPEYVQRLARCGRVGAARVHVLSQAISLCWVWEC